MTRKYLIGLALAAAFGASQAQAEELTGTRFPAVSLP